MPLSNPSVPADERPQSRMRALLTGRFMRNLMSLYAVRVFNQLLPLAIYPFLARVLGPSEWGVVAMAHTFAIHGVYIIQYGFEFSGTRETARNNENGDRLSDLMAGILGAKILLAFAFAGAVTAALYFVPAFEGRNALLAAVLGLALLQGLSPGWFFLGMERMPVWAAIDCTAKVVSTLSIFFLVRDAGDGWLVLASYAAGALVSTAIGHAMALRTLTPRWPTIASVKDSFKLGWNLFLMRLAIMLHAAGNAFLLGLLAAPHHVAFYFIAEKLSRPLSWMSEPINQVLLTRLSGIIGHSPDKARRMASIGLTSLIVAAALLAGGLAVFAPLAVHVLFGDGYEAAVTPLRVMAAAVPIITANMALTSQWLVPNGLDKVLSRTIAFGAALNLVLALTLAPIFYATGMAWTTLLSEFAIMAIFIFSLRKRGINPFDTGLITWLKSRRRANEGTIL